MFFEVLHALRRDYMEKNATVRYHFVIVVDVKLAWGIYCIKGLEGEEPIEMYKGRFMFEKVEIKSVVGVHLISDKIIIIFDGFYVSYLKLPEELVKGKSIINR